MMAITIFIVSSSAEAPFRSADGAVSTRRGKPIRQVLVRSPP